MKIKKLLVLFKTHLDIGFTDFSKNVVEKYMKSFIPDSIDTATKLRQSGEDAKLVWTTGSWLIHEFLRTHSGKEHERFCDAIKNGDISWHGLPFTTHTELMSKELFEYGLSLSKELDVFFGRKTIAAKMTDVPGHTKAIIPLLKRAGIEFLHIGVNPASAVPVVPPIFRWRADNGDTINVMYQNDYGEFSLIGDSGVAVYFAHTGDNLGAQSSDDIISIFSKLRKEMPDAEIVVTDLNGLALAIRDVEDTLPIVTDEIGDSWIHGIGTDPKKVSWFRSLERIYKDMPKGQDKDRLARGLIMIPEHTWGLDVKKHLKDHDHYEIKDFDRIRKCSNNFIGMEASWQEQREYLLDAVNDINEPYHSCALNAMKEAQRLKTNIDGFNQIKAGQAFNYCGYTIRFNTIGEIDLLEKDGYAFAGENNKLAIIRYEQFSSDDYSRFFEQYNRLKQAWVIEDFTKPGIELGNEKYVCYKPEKVAIYTDGKRIVVKYAFSHKIFGTCGCPQEFELMITTCGQKMILDLAWFNKPANRVAEAIWFGFKPNASNKRISKLGTIIDPKHVVSNGQCRLHGTDYGVIYDNMEIHSLDTALVAPQEPSLLNFVNDKPFDNDEINFNLYNNIWGTNFPMWYDEDARFRFVISV